MNNPIKNAFTAFANSKYDPLWKAWKASTVLEETSEDKFIKIVLQCVDALINSDLEKEITSSATGGIEVQWNKYTNRLHIFVCPCDSYSGERKHILVCGQQYKHRNCDVYIVANAPGTKLLINLETGGYWAADGMGGDDEQFTLIK